MSTFAADKYKLIFWLEVRCCETLAPLFFVEADARIKESKR